MLKPAILSVFTLAISSFASAQTAPTTAPAGTLPSDEKPPAKQADCFPGAIYRKAVSSEDLWTGIDAVVTLPTLVTDPDRVDAKTKKPLDNASCYLGGRAGAQEIDAGVSWEVIKEPDGTVSKERKAFRPFWRNKTWATAPAKPDLYFYPGDTIHMICWTGAPNKLKIRFELLARAGHPEAQTPISSHEVEFDAFGFGPGKVQEFKRVTAIDQVKNEGKPTQPTAAHVDGAIWQHVDLLRGLTDRRPFTSERFTDMRCPNREQIKVTSVNDAVGAERIDLVGR